MSKPTFRVSGNCPKRRKNFIKFFFYKNFSFKKKTKVTKKKKTTQMVKTKLIEFEKTNVVSDNIVKATVLQIVNSDILYVLFIIVGILLLLFVMLRKCSK